METTYRFESAIGHPCTVQVEGEVDKPGSLYHIKCEACGRVGVPQEFLVDAEGIAERHAAFGFARP